MNRGFASLHPAPCFLYYVSLVILVMIIYHPMFLFLALCSQVMLNIMQDGGKRLKESIKYYIFLGFLIVLVNPFISHRGRTILFYFFDNPVTLEAVIYGIVMMMSLLTVLIAFVSYNLVITPDKFMFLFSSIFPKTAFICMMAMRFVPVLKKRSQDIALVQKTRGTDTSTGSFIQRVKNGMQIMIILITWSLEEAIITSRSMRARGYGITKNRSSYFDYKMTKRDWATLAVIVLSCGNLLYFWRQGLGHFQIYPELSALTLDINIGLFLVASFIYLAIPVAIEGVERLIWL
ncbi:MAG: energy-coupling factor transporter transmembrane component T [Tepidanaerobacteraceae bacterium]|jgi:energy-coupling factor transport system permease protein